jgi:hypothetical protein
MKIAKTAFLCISMMFFHNTSFASDFVFLLRDFALPNQQSDYQTLGYCNSTNSYVPPQDCSYGYIPSGTTLLQNDKELVIDFSSELSGPQDVQAFDRYITFKEAGNNPAFWDDYLRVEFDPDRKLIVSLISNPSMGLPSGSMNVGNFINNPNDIIDVSGLFGFRSGYAGQLGPGGVYGDPSDPYLRFIASPLPVALLVQPTAVDEPASLALIFVALLPFVFYRVRKTEKTKNQ